LLFEFGRPLLAAEMRLKCCGTQVLNCKGVYCSAHNAAVPSGIRDSESVGPGRTRIRPDTGAGQTRWRLSWHPESSPNLLRRPRRLASVVLLVGGAGPVIVLVILAAGAGVALAAGACALAVLDVAVPAFGGARAGGGGGARAGGSAGYNTQNKPSRGCTSQAC
jgi:hypothetical protein